LGGPAGKKKSFYFAMTVGISTKNYNFSFVSLGKPHCNHGAAEFPNTLTS
jgi:hypothetical protein